jgi:hypothetical protein
MSQGWICLLVVVAWSVFAVVWGFRAEAENQRIIEANKNVARWHGPSGAADVDDVGGDSGCGGCGGCGDA